jgi:hypothetical protein
MPPPAWPQKWYWNLFVVDLEFLLRSRKTEQCATGYDWMAREKKGNYKKVKIVDIIFM